MTTLALVGCAHIHTPGFIKAIRKRDVVSVKTVWDHDARRGEKRAAELGAQFVPEVEAVFADGAVQAVVICSETDRHEQLVAPAGEAKKHLFVEKPLGLGAGRRHRRGGGEVPDRLLHARPSAHPVHQAAHRGGAFRQDHPRPRERLPRRRAQGFVRR